MLAHSCASDFHMNIYTWSGAGKLLVLTLIGSLQEAVVSLSNNTLVVTW